MSLGSVKVDGGQGRSAARAGSSRCPGGPGWCWASACSVPRCSSSTRSSTSSSSASRRRSWGCSACWACDLPHWAQWLVFSALAVVAMFAFRRRLYEMVRNRGGHVDERLTVGDRVVVADAPRAGPERPRRISRLELDGAQYRRRRRSRRVAKWSSRRWTASPCTSRRSKQHMGSMYVVFVIAILVAHRPRQDGGGRAAAERLRRRDARALQPDDPGRLPHPGAVHRPHRLQAQPQGRGDGHPGAGLHHARQRAGRRRRRAVPAGAGCEQGLLRHHELPLRDHPARADDAAQRDRQDRARPHLRGAADDQRERRRRARQGIGALGRQGAALRDQEHQSAEGHPRGDGKADARGAREARRRADFRGRARREDQSGRRREAARHQGIGRQQAAADQRGAGPGGGDPRGRDRDRRRTEAGRRGAGRPRRHRGDAAAHRRGVRQAVRHARERGLEHARSSRRTCRTSPR